MPTRLGPFKYCQGASKPPLHFHIEPHCSDAGSILITAHAYTDWGIKDFSDFLDGVFVIFHDEPGKEYSDSVYNLSRKVSVGGPLMRRIIRDSSLKMEMVNLCRGVHREYTGIEAGISRLLANLVPEPPVIETGHNLDALPDTIKESRFEASRDLNNLGVNDARLDQLTNPNLSLSKDGDTYRIKNSG